MHDDGFRTPDEESVTDQQTHAHKPTLILPHPPLDPLLLLPPLVLLLPLFPPSSALLLPLHALVFPLLVGFLGGAEPEGAGDEASGYGVGFGLSFLGLGGGGGGGGKGVVVGGWGEG